MATKYSATVMATAEKPYILTHLLSGERYAYSAAHLERTRKLYASKGMRLESHYLIEKEFHETNPALLRRQAE